MRILSCFIPATEGVARVAGFHCLEHPIEVKRRIGYLPETPPLYLELTTVEYLTFMGRLKGMSANDLRRGQVPMRVLAYCLMPTHFHVAVWPRHDGELSGWMQWLLTAARAALPRGLSPGRRSVAMVQPARVGPGGPWAARRARTAAEGLGGAHGGPPGAGGEPPTPRASAE